MTTEDKGTSEHLQGERTDTQEAVARPSGYFASFKGLGARTWKVTLLSLGGWTLVNADNSLFNLNYPLLQGPLHISDNQVGYIYALVYAIGALSTFIAGPIMDRMGRKPVFQACLFAAVLGSILTAGATGIVLLMVARSFTQIGASTEWMAGQVMVAEEAPPESRGRLIGLAQIGYPLGFFFGSLLSLIIVPLFGWRILFLFGIIPIAIMIWARRAVPETARFVDFASAGSSEGSATKRNHVRELFARDLRRSSILVALWHVTYAFGFGSISSFLPSVFAGYDIPQSKVYVASAIATILAAVGYLLCAAVGEKIGRREASILWLVLGAISGLYMAYSSHTFTTMTIGYSLIYFFIVGHITSAVGYATEVFPTRVRGTGTNLVAGMEWIGFLIAGLVGPRMLNGLGVSNTVAIWLFLCPLLAACCALGMRRVRPNAVLEHVAQ